MRTGYRRTMVGPKCKVIDIDANVIVVQQYVQSPYHLTRNVSIVVWVEWNLVET
jgi:hypothetical protein